MVGLIGVTLRGMVIIGRGMAYCPFRKLFVVVVVAVFVVVVAVVVVVVVDVVK